MKKTDKKIVKVSIVGQGYVGLPLAIEVAKSGYGVVGFDIDESKILNLRKGVTNIPGIEMGILNKLIMENRYLPTSDPSQMNDSDIVILAVPTPLNSLGEPDTNLLEQASQIAAKHCKNTALIINESTSYPGTLKKLIVPIFTKNFKTENYFASAPERVDPGNLEWNLNNTPRVVAGLTNEATQMVFDFYSTFCEKVSKVSSPEIAEAAKLLENTFRMVNIAFINEFALICNKLNLSSDEVIKAAATKPFGFTRFIPGIGVGGHCIPVDPMYLTYVSKKVGAESSLIDLAHKLNNSMPKRISEIIESNLEDSLQNKKIQVVGITYKPDVADLRESPALEIITELREKGAKVSWHDPLVKEFNGEDSKNLDLDIDLGVILVPHSEINFSIWQDSNLKILDFSSTSNDYGWPKSL